MWRYFGKSEEDSTRTGGGLLYCTIDSQFVFTSFRLHFPISPQINLALWSTVLGFLKEARARRNGWNGIKVEEKRRNRKNKKRGRGIREEGIWKSEVYVRLIKKTFITGRTLFQQGPRKQASCKQVEMTCLETSGMWSWTCPSYRELSICQECSLGFTVYPTGSTGFTVLSVRGRWTFCWSACSAESHWSWQYIVFIFNNQL